MKRKSDTQVCIDAPVSLPESPHWYACYTRGRHEKQVAARLARRGAESFLPVFAEERQWTNRVAHVEWPLFPGYVFARFSLRNLSEMLGTPGVVTVVQVNGYPTPIRDSEIENMRRFVEALRETGMVPSAVSGLRVGQRVRVVDGPFQGVECVVIERRGGRRILVELRSIGEGLEVDLGVGLVEPVRTGTLLVPLMRPFVGKVLGARTVR